VSGDEAALRQESADWQQAFLRSLEQLAALRRFPGEPAEFWPSFLRALMACAGAVGGWIATRGPGRDSPWQLIARGPEDGNGSGGKDLTARLDAAMDQCAREGYALWGRNDDRGAALRVDTGDGQGFCIAVLRLRAMSDDRARELMHSLLFAADLPAAYQDRRIARESKTQVESFAGALDLVVILNERKRFLPAAMAFCNEIAARLSCERVSLGWSEKGYIELAATSHVDRFDRKSDAVQMLEAAMEEAFDQDSDVVVPGAGQGAVSRDHQSFARAHDSRYLCSLPLHIEQQPVAVLTCERTTTPFSERELQQLRLFCDLGCRRLADLRESDRWFGARFAARAREALGKLIGFEHTWLKLIGLLAAVLLAVLLFARVPYHVSAPVTLRTDDVAVLSAPFDGHIEKVSVRVGDSVTQGQELATLDQTDLLLSEAQILAEKESYQGELAKARAAFSLADMRIAQARVDQASARYDQVRYQLDQSVIRAPFSGVVVEGDLRQDIGLPVRQGETLFKLARIHSLYARLEVSERDIRQVQTARTGEIALTAQPQQAFRVVVTRIEPDAVSKQTGNVFIVDCAFPDGLAAWWRPGMTGVARLEVGPRRLLWVLTHRTADFLRLRLWW
jgi:RND family efflux transporter MFP subunit